jgi:hypothetical protein
MSERAFYPDTNDGSSTSNVLARSITRSNALSEFFFASTIQRFNESLAHLD